MSDCLSSARVDSRKTSAQLDTLPQPYLTDGVRLCERGVKRDALLSREDVDCDVHTHRSGGAPRK